MITMRLIRWEDLATNVRINVGVAATEDENQHFLVASEALVRSKLQRFSDSAYTAIVALRDQEGPIVVDGVNLSYGREREFRDSRSVTELFETYVTKA